MHRTFKVCLSRLYLQTKKSRSNVGYFSRFVSVIIAGDKRGAKANKKALTLANQGFSFGAGEMNRTPDLLITNELLYRLSYTGLASDYSVEW